MSGLVDDLAAALPGKADVSQEGATLTVRWTDRDATARILLEGDTANWVSLRARKKGLYERLCEVTPPVFKAHGFRRYLMCPGDETALELLRKHAPWKRCGRNQWEWVL